MHIVDNVIAAHHSTLQQTACRSNDPWTSAALLTFAQQNYASDIDSDFNADGRVDQILLQALCSSQELRELAAVATSFGILTGNQLHVMNSFSSDSQQ